MNNIEKPTTPKTKKGTPEYYKMMRAARGAARAKREAHKIVEAVGQAQEPGCPLPDCLSDCFKTGEHSVLCQHSRASFAPKV